MNVIDELFPSRSFPSKKPVLMEGTGARFRRLRGWPVLASIFERGHPNCWLAKNGTLAPGSNGRLELTAALAGYENGYSVVVRHSEQAHDEIKQLAEAFANVFRKPVDVQLYSTPESKVGFDWHYDIEDVFVIQASGVKEFVLRENTQDEPDMFDPSRYREGLEQWMRGEEIHYSLKAGDVLYIPSGFWHKALALTDSFHLSVGVMSRAKQGV